VPFGISLMRVVGRDPHPAIPDNDRTGAVLAFRDGTLERAIVGRMILHMNRETLFPGDETGAFGNCPALQRAIEFKAQVIVQLARPVLVYHKPLP
jgi:hypothetical protein